MNIGSIQSGTTVLASATPKALNFSALYDPKDTNKDGMVSPSEELTYSFKHPEREALKRLKTPRPVQNPSRSNTIPLNAYTQKGTLNTSGKIASSLIDVQV